MVPSLPWLLETGGGEGEKQKDIEKNAEKGEEAWKNVLLTPEVDDRRLWEQADGSLLSQSVKQVNIKEVKYSFTLVIFFRFPGCAVVFHQ